MLDSLGDMPTWPSHQGVSKGLNRAAFLLFAGYLLILPISHTTTIREFLFWSLVLVTFWAAYRRELKLYLPVRNAWIVYAAVAVFSLSYALNPAYSLREIRIEICYSILIMLIAASWIRSEQAMSQVAWVLVIGNIFLVCCGVAQGIYLRLNSGTAPLNIGVGRFSTYVVTVIPFIAVQALLISQRKKVISIMLFLLLIINLIALYFTGNRAGGQAVFLELILLVALFWYYRMPFISNRVFITAFVFLFALSVAFNLAILAQKGGWGHLLNDVRLDLWRLAIGNIESRPLSGGGFGIEAFKTLNPEYYKTHRLLWHAHNVFLNKGVQMGIPGILAFCLLLAAALREILISKGSNNNHHSTAYALAGIIMLAGIVVKNFTDDFFIRDNAWMFWLLTAAIIGAARGEKVEVMKKILFIRRDNIGDLICTTPAVSAVRERFPDAKIGMLVNTYNAPVVEGNPDIDEIYVYEKAKHAEGKGRLSVWLNNMGVIMKIRRERYDVAIGCGSYSPRIAKYTFLAGAGARIGFFPKGGKGLSYTLPIEPPQEKEHEVQRTFRLLEPLGISGVPGRLRLYPQKQELERFDQFKKTHGSRSSPPLIAVAISARIKENKWPVEKFIMLIDALLEHAVGSVLLLWAPGSKSDLKFPGDDEIAKTVISRFGPKILAYPTRSLQSLIAAVSSADIVVTLDTGSLHMSAAAQKPTIALMTERKLPSWHPWMTKAATITAKKGVEEISVEEVFNAITAMAKPA